MIGRRSPRALTFGLAFFAAVAAVLVSAGGAAAAPDPSTWLQTGYNAAGSNANLGDKTFTAKNVKALKLLHTYRADPNYNGCGGGATATAFSESRTYTVVDATLTAYLDYSGKVLWKATNPPETAFQSYDSTIAVSNGQVVISGNECGSNDPEGFIQAFDSETGKPTWNHLFGDGISAVEVSGQQVVAHVRAGIASDPSTTVLSLLDGSTTWTATSYCNSEPHVVGKLVFVDTCDGSVTSLRALKVTTGKTVWSRAGSYSVLGGDSDAATAQHLFVENRHGIVRDLNPATGAVRFNLSGAGGPIIAVDDTRVYTACSAAANAVCAFDLATGREIWSAGFAASSGFVANGLLYSSSGLVLDASTGKTVTTLTTGSPKLVGSGLLGLVDTAGNLKVYGV